MSKAITVPFGRLTLNVREIGIHRGRRWGFREIFGFRTYACLTRRARWRKGRSWSEGKTVPSHVGWSAQREALSWLVEKGCDGIYALDDKGIRITRTAFQTYYIFDGNHRALALFVLGEGEVRARIDGEARARIKEAQRPGVVIVARRTRS